MARETKPRGRRWWPWLAVAVLAVLGVSTAVAALKLQYLVETGPEFVLHAARKEALEIHGLRYTPRAKVARVFASDFGRSVFRVPLAERRRRLLAIDWVEDATVARIWPSRLAVYIRERKPVAFVFLGGSVLLVDAQGVLLEPPAQAQFPFPVLSGVREEDTEASRRKRVEAMLALLEDLGSRARDISEVNAADVDNLKVVAQVDGRVVELIMGDANFGPRYRNFLSHFPEIRKRLNTVTAFDLRLDDRISARD
jgi:cell division protein FtsQ